MSYKRRPGTSGIRGHLYESKLLSLLLFRAQHDDNIEEFVLASNMDDIGVLDDICLKVKLKNHVQPIALFFQVKHRESNKQLTVNNKNNLVKYFESYLKIKQKFNSNSEDQIFNGEFDETECLFVIYTNERGDLNNDLIEHSYISDINDLIATGKDGTRPIYTNEDIDFLSKLIAEQEIIALAKHFAYFLNDKVNYNMMNDEYILRYHALLAKEVVNVSEIQPEGYRIIKFRNEFLNTTDHFLAILRNVLYQKVLATQNIEEDTLQELFLLFSSSPSVSTLSHLIGRAIAYSNGKFELLINTTIDVKKLEQINLSQSIVDQATEMAAKDILQSSIFKVPTTFGNKDLKIRNNRTDKRLDHLTNRIVELIEKSKPSNILTLDETTGIDLLELNGGLGSAVGNLLVIDEDEGLLKFADNYSLLAENASALLFKLNNTITDLYKYRLDVRTSRFPKLSFNFNKIDKATVQYFLNRLIFFTEQADETNVEKIMKNEIELHQDPQISSHQMKTDAIFLKYHDEIQKLWMLQEEAPYLTKSSNIYHNVVASIVNEQLINVNSMMYINKINNAKHKFNENAINRMKSIIHFIKTIIVTNVTMLTVIKVIQCLEVKQYTVLDIAYLLNLSVRDFHTLCEDLRNTNIRNTVIVCDNLLINSIFTKRLEKLMQAVERRNTIVITNKMFVDIVKKYLPTQFEMITDHKISLIDLNEESQEDILKTAKIVFQGQELRLDSLVDDKSVRLIEDTVLNDLILEKPIHIGGILNYSNYNEIKNLYIGRRVATALKKREEEKLLQTLLDLNDNVVLITAEPGMGKTTLLTHLAINTQKLHKNRWILRVNLLNHSKIFSEWQNNKTVINTLETLKFLIQAILSLRSTFVDDLIISLSENDGDVLLKYFTGNDLIAFELNMFLHLYNTGNVIFLFDGFDEICPHYMNEVITMLVVMKDDPRRNKIWITSRPYEELVSSLQKHFNGFYKLMHFTDTEQAIYINNYIDSNKILKELNSKQLENIEELLNFMTSLEINKMMELCDLCFPLLKVYQLFVDYLLNDTNFAIDEDFVQPLCKTIEIVLKLDTNAKQTLDFCRIPLHLHSVAEYFVDIIKDTNDWADKWNLMINTHLMYKKLLITKLKHVRFQDKNNMNIYNPDVIMTYEKELTNCVAMHNKLAAYAVFYNIRHIIFNSKELEEIKAMMDTIKQGQEKTGMICGVSNDIPIFIHTTFTEHFAIEFICDIIKSEKSNNEIFTAIWNEMLTIIAIRNSFNLLIILFFVSQIDPKLSVALNEIFVSSEDSDESPNEDENDEEDENLMETIHGYLSELNDNSPIDRSPAYMGYVKYSEFFEENCKTESKEKNSPFIAGSSSAEKELHIASVLPPPEADSLSIQKPSTSLSDTRPRKGQRRVRTGRSIRQKRSCSIL